MVGVVPRDPSHPGRSKSDASSTAYAAVVFLLMKNGELYSSRLIASKTRVAPLQQQTTPRLELLGTLLLARLITSVANSLRSEITLEQAACYSDSQIALCWIQGLEREWKPFIQNRVSEIRKLVPVCSWKFCPGKENPADLPWLSYVIASFGGMDQIGWELE